LKNEVKSKFSDINLVQDDVWKPAKRKFNFISSQVKIKTKSIFHLKKKKKTQHFNAAYVS